MIAGVAAQTRRERIRARLMWRFAGLAVLAVVGIVATHVMAWRWIDAPQAARPLLMSGVLLSAAAVGVLVWLWLRIDEQVVLPLRMLANTLQTAVHAETEPDAQTIEQVRAAPGAVGPAAADLLLALGESRRAARAERALAAADADQQKHRLAAVLQDLDEAVLICSPAHRIRLLNRAAVSLLAGNGEIGLGRSLAEGLAPGPLQHAWERLCSAARRGEATTTQAVCASQDGNRLFQCRISLLGAATPGEAAPGSDGYLMSMRDITHELASHVAQDGLLTEALALGRETAARLQARLSRQALSGPAVPAEVIEQVQQLSARVQALGEARQRVAASHWPMEDVHVSDLLDEVTRRAEGRVACRIDDALVLHCDGLSVIALLGHLVARLAPLDRDGCCTLTAIEVRGHGLLEFSWRGRAVTAEETAHWQADALPEVPGGLPGRDILALHRSELILPLEADVEASTGLVAGADSGPETGPAVEASVAMTDGKRAIDPAAAEATAAAGRQRLGVPLALAGGPAAVGLAPVHGSGLPDRPEFYDFELPELPGENEVLDAPLESLSFVVFDTETTGLEPFNGDEIVQIAGVRVLNGRVLAGEVFETLVDPQRPIPSSSIRIHGISPEMVAGAPTVTEALTMFRRFARGSVLVAHNAAFDMAFLRRPGHGVAFDNPVLDTVLISAWLFDHTGAHGLDDLARRVGVETDQVVRHSAAGDTWITAQVFVRLQAMLRGKGIGTLRSTLEACAQMRAIRRAQARYS